MQAWPAFLRISPHACRLPSLQSTCFLDLGRDPISPILMSVSPVGHEEECRPAGGRAVCGPALAGRDVPALHEGGGAADDPWKAAVLRVLDLPSPGGPEAYELCSPSYSGLPPVRKCRAQGRSIHLPSPGPLRKHRNLSPPIKFGPCSLLWSSFHPDPLLHVAASRNGLSQGSPTVKKQCIMYFLGVSVRVLGTRAC